MQFRYAVENREPVEDHLPVGRLFKAENDVFARPQLTQDQVLDGERLPKYQSTKVDYRLGRDTFCRGGMLKAFGKSDVPV
eukprot:4751587-Pleurochrysis_carterae.AAC.1